MARGRLQAARTNLDQGLPFASIGLSYYAMLYAARAALSEEDLWAKTHSGTWAAFGKTFVVPGRFDRELTTPINRIREQREGADYEAENPTHEEAESALAHAERFVAAVDELTGG